MVEIRDLLVEVRDLLRPVADAYQDEFDRREAEREQQRLDAVRALLSTDKRRKAWTLADGTLTQRQIAKKAGMDAGGASRLFKSLRDLDVLTASANPEKAVEVSL